MARHIDTAGNVFETDVTFNGAVTLNGAVTYGSSATGSDRALSVDISLFSTQAESIPSPWAGDIVKIQVVVNGEATATGPQTVTASIGATAVTGGQASVPSGSALKTLVTVSPTAARTVAVGSVITLDGAGTNSAAGAVGRVVITIRPS